MSRLCMQNVPFLIKVRIFILLILSFHLPAHLQAQEADSGIVVNDIAAFYNFSNQVAGYIPQDVNLADEYSPEMIFKNPRKKGNIPPSYVTWKVIHRFKLINTNSEPVNFYYFPGFYYYKTFLYKVGQGRAIPIPVTAPQMKDSVSFRLVTIPAMDSVTLLAECYPIRTYANSHKPKIISESFIESYITIIRNSWNNEALFTYIICGFLLMMILFSLANYLLEGKREFLYYALYALFLGFMLFTKIYYSSRSNLRSFFYESYFDFILQGLGICFYMAFMMRFLETRRDHPFLQKLYIAAISFVLICLSAFSYLHFMTDNFAAETFIENYIAKGVLLILVIVFLVYAARHRKNKLFIYLFWGNFFFLFFAALSLAEILIPKRFLVPPGTDGALIFYETGIVFELIFFLIALAYKNRHRLIERTKESERLKLENERKEMEKQVAVMAAHQEERERISADMHDELGSGITTIRLMSEIAKNKLKEGIPAEIEKISGSANDLLNKMNAIIWSMNSSNDTVDNLVSYIRAYAIEFFDSTPITCTISVPEQIPHIDISGDKRRNLFLCVKETLNNTLKHSKADKVAIHISINHSLVIKIADNGIGITSHPEKGFGNGLKNMKRRMKIIGGQVTMENDHGAVTTLELPL